MADRDTIPLLGCDGLRQRLKDSGFKIARDHLLQGHGCNWYAYRRSALRAAECECNEGKGVQLVVKPSEFCADGRTWERAEVDVTGEAGGVWFKLLAYSLAADDLPRQLARIEAGLVAAWNALPRGTDAPL